MPTRKRADTAQKKGGSYSVNSKIGTSATSHHAVNGQETTPPVASRHAKRKHADEHDRALARSPKRAHLEYGKPTRHAAATTTRAPLPAINRAPTEALAVLVFGNGDAGELGLGPTVQEATRPCVNPFLDPDNPSAHRVVQLACGGMHTVALTQDNRIVTWGVNDNGALGRSTEWEGALHDIDDEEEGELNPFESTPTSIPTGCFPRGTKFVQVAAGDSCSFALTDTGLVYGWGTFKGNKRFGHDASGPIITRQATPRLIHGLSNITQIACGANHALALDVKGVIWTWGCGEQNQLGRHLSGRYDTDSYTPGPVNIRNIKHIGCGDYHSLAVDRKGQVWAWGLNSFGQAGHAKGAGTEPVLPYPMKIPSLRSKNVVCLDGGAHHSAAVTADGHCFVWGGLDSGQLGIAFNSEQLQDPTLIRYDARDKPRICLRPTPVRGLEVRHVACGSDHTIFITKAGAAYASGFNAQGQLGLGGDDDVVEVAQPIRGKALKDRVLVWACAGGQFSVIAARSESKPGAPAADGAAAS